jgi:hypothetical protein
MTDSQPNAFVRAYFRDGTPFKDWDLPPTLAQEMDVIRTYSPAG